MNGEDAINKALKLGTCTCTKFKAIIMDCEMPIKNGFESTKELLELMRECKIPEVPIIACTAYIGDEEKSKCYDCGMKGFMNKPVLMENLRETLKNFGVIL